MKKESVPQDNSPTYAGIRKLLYAVDERGKYVGVPSNGWEVEAFATQTAVAELNRLCREAWRRARAGEASALEFHMYRHRMEPATLAATAGIGSWRVRRHIQAKHFAKLPERVLVRYANALGISIEELRTVPESFDVT
jgi:hypothetical protein